MSDDFGVVAHQCEDGSGVGEEQKRGDRCAQCNYYERGIQRIGERVELTGALAPRCGGLDCDLEAGKS